MTEPAVRRGRSPEGRAEVRRALTVAAVELFATTGYDETTVDDITAAAGVARRTFFRYFPSKEDAVSPDHEAALERVTEIFETAHPTEPTTSLVLRAGEAVLDLYADDAALSVRRFRLTHQVPALRDRESASVHHYRRLFTRHLRRRYAGQPDGELRAAVVGAAIVAAHNLALRSWLTDGAPPAGLAGCRADFRRVAELLPPEPGEQHGLDGVAARLERVVGRLERTAPA
ncbi:MAG: TetR family transcriptional regulator [Pseudonocardia sp.]